MTRLIDSVNKNLNVKQNVGSDKNMMSAPISCFVCREGERRKGAWHLDQLSLWGLLYK